MNRISRSLIHCAHPSLWWFSVRAMWTYIWLLMLIPRYLISCNGRGNDARVKVWSKVRMSHVALGPNTTARVFITNHVTRAGLLSFGGTFFTGFSFSSVSSVSGCHLYTDHHPAWIWLHVRSRFSCCSITSWLSRCGNGSLMRLHGTIFQGSQILILLFTPFPKVDFMFPSISAPYHSQNPKYVSPVLGLMSGSLSSHRGC